MTMTSTPTQTMARPTESVDSASSSQEVETARGRPGDLGTHVLRALLLPALATLLLWFLPPLPERLYPLAVFVLITLGSVPGLLVIGHVADAHGAPVDRTARARILDDRFLGTFGTCAIIISVLVGLGVALAGVAPRPHLAVVPLLAASAGWLAHGLTGAVPFWIRAICIGLAVPGSMALVSTGIVAPLGGALAASIALLAGVCTRGDRRGGAPVTPYAAGHGALLSLLITAST